MILHIVIHHAYLNTFILEHHNRSAVSHLYLRGKHALQKLYLNNLNILK